MVPLVYHPDERLTTVVDAIDSIDESVRRLAEAMIETLHAANGIGLAGPQIAHMERIFVVHVSGDEPRVFINPEIVAISPDETVYEEGCLSIPGVYADVSRPRAVTVEAFDVLGKPFRLDAEGMLARVIQHEYDHLEGVLFLKYLSRRKRERLLRGYRPPAEAS